LNERRCQWQEFIDTVIGPGGEFGEGVRKPCGGVEAVELCGAKQGLNGGGTLAGTF